MNTDRKSVGVVGAGIVGVCAALALQRRGHDVTVIDPELPGNGASFGNAGCLNASSIVPMSMPGIIKNVPSWLFDPLGPLSIRWRYLPRAVPWLIKFLQAGQPQEVVKQARAMRSLLKDTVPLMTSLAREAGAHQLIRKEGHLYVYRSGQAFANDKGGWELRRANGVDTRILDAAELHDFDPNLSACFTQGVLVEENGHTTDPHRLTSTLFDRILANGGKYIRSRAIGLTVDGGLLRSIATTSGDLVVDAAVITAGAHSKPFTGLLGNEVPLDTERGYHIVIKTPAAAPRIPTTDAEGKFIATPMDGGLRISGTVELAGLEAPPNWDRAHALFKHARNLLPGLGSHNSDSRYSTWMGFRPSMPDSLPVIGPSRRARNVIYAFGHGHVGMTGAPKTAEVVSQLISGEKPSIDITPFSADRFN
jgi:glycine/D-amino acid oxidase-like deaminating enzyme